MSGKSDETRAGVELTNLDQPLFDGAGATKRDLVDYLDGVRDRILPELADRGGKVFVDSTRVGGATVIAAYSPRVRPGVPVSFPVAWDELDHVHPTDFTVHNALDRLADGDRWAAVMPSPQRLGADLVAEGHAIPVARVQAMHEGKRRARAQRDG